MWTAFAASVGGAAAGLTGLTFIVVAVRYDTLAVSEEHRSRAAQTVCMYVTLTVGALLVTVPQPVRVLGGEMTVVALLSAVLLWLLETSARHEQAKRPSITLRIGLPLFITSIMANGVVLLLGEDGGLYFFVAGAAIGLVLGVTGAWTFLTRAGLDPSMTKS